MRALISPDQIAKRIQELAVQLNARYVNEELSLVIIMKGALFFAADLMRKLTVPCTLDYIRASSYGERGQKRGELNIIGLEELKLSGKNVLVIDDIFDSGNTLSQIAQALQKQHPKTLRTIVLLKKNVKRQTEYLPDEYLFEIEDAFVVGYGLDYKEHYRELPGVFAMEQE